MMLLALLLATSKPLDVPKVQLPAIEIPAIETPYIDIPAIEIPGIELPDLDLPDLHRIVIAHADRKQRQHDDDDDEMDEKDNDDCDDCGPPPPPDEGRDARPEQRGNVRIYRMTPIPPMPPMPPIPPTPPTPPAPPAPPAARTEGNGIATLAVKGPITFHIATQSADLDVLTTDRHEVKVHLDSPLDVSLSQYGDRVEAHLRGRWAGHDSGMQGAGKIHVELPKGSRLEASSMSGDITVRGVDEARLHTLSGDLHVSQVGRLEAKSVSGDAQIEDAQSQVRLGLVSGKASVSMRGTSPQLEFQSTSGGLDFHGICGRDCHIASETVSGDVRLNLEKSSSFGVRYASHSGELRDGMELSVQGAQRGERRGRSMLSGTYGKGEGVVEVESFSGSLELEKK